MDPRGVDPDTLVWLILPVTAYMSSYWGFVNTGLLPCVRLFRPRILAFGHVRFNTLDDLICWGVSQDIRSGRSCQRSYGGSIGPVP